jgi:hypothetical protein
VRRENGHGRSNGGLLHKEQNENNCQPVIPT